MIVSDYGTERTAYAVLAWSGDVGSISRRATQNGFVESFDGRMRDELLN